MRAMSADHHSADAPGHEGAVAHLQTADHGDDHGHDDQGHGDQGHGEEPLGPIDVAAWGAGLLGLVIGVAIAACFVLATSPLV